MAARRLSRVSVSEVDPAVDILIELRCQYIAQQDIFRDSLGSSSRWVEVGRVYSSSELCFQVFALQVDGDRHSNDQSPASILVADAHFFAWKNVLPNNLGRLGTILSSANQRSFSLIKFLLASKGFHFPLNLSVSTTRLINLMLCCGDARRSL